ncbi:cytoskeletal protein CcmA (bactofilin family) [Microbacteriaceae bacterium SG_E_30_P1]|uniref:Cytoskeletal protein CcmA (Bactofilin family) n=1 Tax=Antiquaquibacter oligotrophicus TaxID=2880260 RepID=A0ABT6KM02_9MICO|nr:polymer-forming cytoskeletal protein [Antiquaquibacter oligotrophicus]MDH6180204.1 cytoskeletal protein CcmA (bactofilin family) [Antiquaquibacter oligotrophicus]UDF14049.1 polymer-forming cytoskeletal protein [Antiquaquibacter oligotrophicus]
MQNSEPEIAAGSPPLVEEMPGALVVGEDEVYSISGEHSGPVEAYGTLTVEGTLRGALTIGSLARVMVSGDIEGPVDIKVAGTLMVLPRGRIAGTITNHGSFINQGWRSGRVDGRLPDDQEGSFVAEPLPGIERFPTLPVR